MTKQKLKQYLYPHVHGSTTDKSQEVEANQGFVNRPMDEQNVLHPYNGVLLNLRRKDVLAHATTRMSLEDAISREISRHRRTNIVEVKSKIKLARGRGGGRNGELVFNGDSVSVWEDEESRRWTVVMVAQQCEYT